MRVERRRALQAIGAAAAPAAALVSAGSRAQGTSALRVGVARFVGEAHHFVARADRSIALDPDAAVAAHAASIGIPSQRLAGIYRRLNFAMSLDEGLIRNLELQPLWAGRQGRAGGLPDYRAIVASQPLARVKPGSVNLLR